MAQPYKEIEKRQKEVEKKKSAIERARRVKAAKKAKITIARRIAAEKGRIAAGEYVDDLKMTLALLKAGPISSRGISDKLDVSRQTAHSRMKALTDLGFKLKTIYGKRNGRLAIFYQYESGSDDLFEQFVIVDAEG